jgi:hypothetical protein
MALATSSLQYTCHMPMPNTIGMALHRKTALPRRGSLKVWDLKIVSLQLQLRLSGRPVIKLLGWRPWTLDGEDAAKQQQQQLNTHTVNVLYNSRRWNTALAKMTVMEAKISPFWRSGWEHVCMARGGHGLQNFHPGLPETTLWLFQGWPSHRASGLRPSSTPLETPRHRRRRRGSWSSCDPQIFEIQSSHI